MEVFLETALGDFLATAVLDFFAGVATFAEAFLDGCAAGLALLVLADFFALF